MVSVQTVAEGWAARGSQQMGTHSGLQGQKEVSGDILPAAAVSSGCTGLVRSYTEELEGRGRWPSRGQQGGQCGHDQSPPFPSHSLWIM